MWCGGALIHIVMGRLWPIIHKEIWTYIAILLANLNLSFIHGVYVCPAIHHWINAIALLVYCDMVDALLTSKQHAWREWSQSNMKSSRARFHTPSLIVFQSPMVGIFKQFEGDSLLVLLWLNMPSMAVSICKCFRWSFWRLVFILSGVSTALCQFPFFLFLEILDYYPTQSKANLFWWTDKLTNTRIQQI